MELFSVRSSMLAMGLFRHQLSYTMNNTRRDGLSVDRLMTDNIFKDTKITRNDFSVIRTHNNIHGSYQHVLR
jgi:hypothetical protein